MGKAIKAGLIMILGGLLGEVGTALLILNEAVIIKVAGGALCGIGAFFFLYGVILLYRDLFSMIFGCIYRTKNRRK